MPWPNPRYSVTAVAKHFLALRQRTLLLRLTHRRGDDGQEAGGTVAEDVTDLMRQGKQLVVALAGGALLNAHGSGPAQPPRRAWC